MWTQKECYGLGVRFLQASDFHIGAPLTGLGEKGRRLRSELLLAFSRMVQLCRAEKPQLLLLAGDLFDQGTADSSALELICSELATLKETRVFIAPGNHDPAALGSPYQEQSWPDSVHIFKGPLEVVELPELKTRVFGAGFVKERQTTSLLSGLQTPQDDWINIGVLHGDLSPQSVYNPLTPPQIAGTGLDYLALGHIHLRSALEKAGSTYYAYSGCPAGRGFDECGDKGVYLGQVEKGRVHLAFHSLGGRQFLEVPVDITDCSTSGEMLAAVEKAIDEFPEQTRHFYRFRLRGSLPLAAMPAIDLLQQSLADRLWYVQVKDETQAHVDWDVLAQERSLKGVFVKRMLAELNQAQAAGDEERAMLCRQAVKLGLEAFSGEVTRYGD